MSAEILHRVFRAAPAALTAYERLLLVRIAWYVDNNGANCYASVSSLAHDTGATDRGVRNAMRNLQGKDFIVVARGKGPRGTNRVALNMAVIEEQGSSSTRLDLNHDAGLHHDSSLHGESASPERSCREHLNDGSGNKQERQEVNTLKTVNDPSGRQPDGDASAEELIETGLAPEDFASYMRVRRKKDCRFVDAPTRKRWIEKFRGFYAEGKDTTDMLHQMIEGGWKGPVADKWKQRLPRFRPATDEDDVWGDLGGGVQCA